MPFLSRSRGAVTKDVSRSEDLFFVADDQREPAIFSGTVRTHDKSSGAGNQLSFDIYAYRSGGTDQATLAAVRAFVQPFAIGDHLEVFDRDLGGPATAVMGDPAGWGDQEHLLITYNRPTPARSLSLLRVIHRIATLGEQTLSVPTGFPAVTVDAAREHAAPDEVDSPLMPTADELLDYWTTNGAI